MFSKQKNRQNVPYIDPLPFFACYKKRIGCILYAAVFVVNTFTATIEEYNAILFWQFFL
jgi:hypothetical protein